MVFKPYPPAALEPELLSDWLTVEQMTAKQKRLFAEYSLTFSNKQTAPRARIVDMARYLVGNKSATTRQHLEQLDHADSEKQRLGIRESLAWVHCQLNCEVAHG